MAAQRITYMKAHLEDRPGALLQVMEDLKSRNIALLSAWGFATREGRAELFVIPKAPDKLRALWKQSGTLVEEGVGFLVKGTDRTGALVKTLETVSAAGINLTAVHAIAVAGKYGSFLWVAPGDVEKMAEALGAR